MKHCRLKLTPLMVKLTATTATTTEKIWTVGLGVPPCKSVHEGDGGSDSGTIDLVFGNEGKPKPKSKAETMKP